jgi:uncharacterized OB-fold protein
MCPSCGATFYPPRRVCARCLAELEPAELSTKGVVYTYTVVHQAGPGFETPYTLVYVDLPEGVRVLGRLAGEPRIGMVVELAADVFRPVAEVAA